MSDKRNKNSQYIPTVLCLSGHDPGGGAGIQADIESINARNCRAATIITCLTIQDTSHVAAIQPVEADFFIRQAELILNDYQIAAIKIGLIGSLEIAEAVAKLLSDRPGLPVVLDPVLAAGDGHSLAHDELIKYIDQQLLPMVSLITPNRKEARLLTNQQNIQDCASKLLVKGCTGVLITGADEATNDEVTNELYMDQGVQQWHWPRLPGSYHGSGCTLASAAAAELAKGNDIMTAVTLAQEYTWKTLQQATYPGKGQAVPNRSHL